MFNDNHPSLEACASAVQLMAWVTKDGTTDEIYAALAKWFQTHSTAVFKGGVAAADVEDEDSWLDPSAEEVVDDELDQPSSSSATKQRLEMLLAVQDRAAAEAQCKLSDKLSHCYRTRLSLNVRW